MSRSFLPVLRARLRVTALLCLPATAVLALVVAGDRAPYSFEQPALDWLGGSAAIGSVAWAHLAEQFAAPGIGIVLLGTVVFGCFRGAILRVALYAAFAVTAVLLSEDVGKPLVQRTYQGELTFPSGNVTAVTATAVAAWLTLFPLLRKRARIVTLLLGAAWVLFMSLAVVGAHWHTPLDDVGSLLLSVGIVAAGGAIFEPIAFRRPAVAPGHARTGRRGGPPEAASPRLSS